MFLESCDFKSFDMTQYHLKEKMDLKRQELQTRQMGQEERAKREEELALADILGCLDEPEEEIKEKE